MSLLHAAADNNADWCATILAAHGIASARSGPLWRALAAPPPLYPGLVTLHEGSQQAVDAALAGPVPPGAIKDSFADLALAVQGFECLLTGAWLLAPKAAPAPSRARCVANADDLARWYRGWISDQPDIADIRPFPSSLLANPAIRFVVLDHPATGLAGAILNLGHGVCGVTNLFGAAPDLLPAVIQLAQRLWRGAPVVMWDSCRGRVAAGAAGFTEIGPMRVWLRKSDQ